MTKLQTASVIAAGAFAVFIVVILYALLTDRRAAWDIAAEHLIVEGVSEQTDQLALPISPKLLADTSELFANGERVWSRADDATPPHVHFMPPRELGCRRIRLDVPRNDALTFTLLAARREDGSSCDASSWLLVLGDARAAESRMRPVSSIEIRLRGTNSLDVFEHLRGSGLGTERLLDRVNPWDGFDAALRAGKLEIGAEPLHISSVSLHRTAADGGRPKLVAVVNADRYSKLLLDGNDMRYSAKLLRPVAGWLGALFDLLGL